MAILMLATVTVAVYANSLANGFVWDDEFLIVEAPEIRHPAGAADLLLSPDVVGSYYRPLNRISYLIDYQLFGPSPAGWHAVNLSIHIVNVSLFYLLALQLAGSSGLALGAAALFALHPVNTETVNFISARNNLLALAFVLGSTLVFIRSLRSGSWPGLVASGLLWLLGLLSKESAAPAVAILAAIACSHRWTCSQRRGLRLASGSSGPSGETAPPQALTAGAAGGGEPRGKPRPGDAAERADASGRGGKGPGAARKRSRGRDSRDATDEGAVNRRRGLSALAPHFVFAAIYLWLRFLALGRGAAAAGSGQGLVPLSGLLERLAGNFQVIPRYLELLVCPWRLSIVHELPASAAASLYWLLPVWVLIGVAVCAIVRSRSFVSLFGLLWLVVNFAPIANVVPIPSAVMAERYLYIAGLGLWLIAADAGCAVYRWLGAPPEALSRRDECRVTPRSALRWVAATAGSGSFSRLPRNADRLPAHPPESWVGVLTQKPVAAAAAAALLIVLGGFTMYRNSDWKSDETLFASVLRVDPGSAFGHFNLGNALRDRGQLAEAAKQWHEALRYDPAHSNAMVQLGTYAAVGGDLAQAQRWFSAAVEADDGNAMAHFNLGLVFEKTGRLREAESQYLMFLKHVPVEYRAYVPPARAKLDRIRALLEDGEHADRMGE